MEPAKQEHLLTDLILEGIDKFNSILNFYSGELHLIIYATYKYWSCSAESGSEGSSEGSDANSDNVGILANTYLRPLFDGYMWATRQDFIFVKIICFHDSYALEMILDCFLFYA